MYKSWQTLLKEAVTSPATLLAQLKLGSDLLPAALRASQLFPLRVPQSFITRMQKGNPQDPLLRQVLPLAEEEIIDPNFTEDPLRERSVNPLPGLLHKYSGRVLITLAGACAIHCRYCFRRHFPYLDNKVGGENWKNILAYLMADHTISEVILSGGDPLLVQDDYLAERLNDLARITHLKTVRIHSRLPIVLPERITGNFVDVLDSNRLQSVMVIHCNHANELDGTVASALAQLRQRNIIVFNQSVLLRGVNDSVEALCDLSRGLFSLGVIPYYLHLPDPVKGTTHFTVCEIRAKQLLSEVRAMLPGYLVPRLVQEIADADAKLPL